MRAGWYSASKMFFASKLSAFVTQPLVWVASLLLLTLWSMRRHPALARASGSLALGLLLVLGWEPLPDALLRALELLYPEQTSTQDWAGYAGVIVLGGALEPAYVGKGSGQSALNGAAERMTEVLPLLRHQPHLQVLFSGGEGELFASDLSEAQRARVFFDQQGVARERVLYESASRNTDENATLSRQLPGVNPAARWLLLTSAWHMPRAMAAFGRAGWNVTAYPVDFRAGRQTPWTQYSMDKGVSKWRIALHEWLGLLVHRASPGA